LFLFRNIGKFVLEGGQIVEFFRRQKVQQVEQFFEIILQRRSSQQKFIVYVVLGEKTEKLEEKNFK